MNQTSLIDDMMDIAKRVDRLERMYQIDADKKPVIEFCFDEISDVARIEALILSSIMRINGDYERIPGNSEFSNCRDHNIGPVIFRLRCDKLTENKRGEKLGVGDMLFTHRIY